MINFDYIRPSTSKSAVDALAKDKSAQLIAGGTNLVDLMKKGIASPQKLVDINRLPLSEIVLTKNILRIGALAKNSVVAEHPLVLKHFPLLSMALLAGASPQIRNMASVGGNLMQRTRCPYFYDTALPCNKRQPGSGCSAIGGYNRMHAILGASDKCIAVHPSDMCVALAALNATVIVSSAKGSRRIPFSDFHRLPGTTPEKDNNLQPGELIMEVELPLSPSLAAHSHYTKIRDRASYAFALVSVAAALQVENKKINDIRIALGGLAHRPWRATEAEQFLKGKEATEANFRQAAQLAMQKAKGQGQNNFKPTLAIQTIVQTLKSINV